MAGLISASGELSAKIAAFAAAEQIELRVAPPGKAAVAALAANGRKESTLDSLFEGGFVKCATARALAERIGIGRGEMGKLLNHLDIKVRDCELGCF
ncbi:MAG: hypothetical protein HRF49_00205 [bacterium]|jgi:hypothetical protein